MPLRSRKAGRVCYGGARETHCATCHNRMTPKKPKSFSNIPAFLDLNVSYQVSVFQEIARREHTEIAHSSVHIKEVRRMWSYKLRIFLHYTKNFFSFFIFKIILKEKLFSYFY